MAPRYPHAKWQPLGSQTEDRMKSHDIICLHTMVGSLWGVDRYFRSGGYSGVESHFGVGHDGETLQWQDLDYTADANYLGSHRVISIETADIGEGFPKWDTNDARQVPGWTAAQVDRLADLVAWLCRTYDIPAVMIPDSKPGRRGIGYHRQGVPGFMVEGGEKWSKARGKVCPGDRRIAQIPNVVAKARSVLGVTKPTPGEDKLSQQEVEQIRRDIGFARDQILTRLGVHNPTHAPAKLTPEQLAGIDPARRVDVGFARDQIIREQVAQRAMIEAQAELIEAIAEKVGIELTPPTPKE